MGSSARLNSIQLLRAIAVIMVVYSHVFTVQPAHTKAGNAVEHQFFSLASFGAAGVDIFFVISGFIITYIAAGYAYNNQAGRFLTKRLLRVVPLYWLVTLLHLLLSYWHGIRNADSARLLRSFLIFPFFDDGAYNSPLLIQGWTLPFELLFYTVVALAIQLNRFRYQLLTFLFFLTCIVINYCFTRSFMLPFSFLGNAMMLEFLMGAITAMVFLAAVDVQPRYTTLLLLAGTGALLLTVFTGYPAFTRGVVLAEGIRPLQRVFIWGLPAALIVAGLVLKEKQRVMRVPAFLLAIGDASFSIYLVHLLVLVSMYSRWRKWGVLNRVPPDLLLLISLVLTVLAGCLFYRLVEKPLLHRLNRRVSRPEAPAVPGQI